MNADIRELSVTELESVCGGSWFEVEWGMMAVAAGLAGAIGAAPLVGVAVLCGAAVLATDYFIGGGQ